MTSRVRYYTFTGYNPDDGLDDGRWVYDRRRCVQVWVSTAPPVELYLVPDIPQVEDVVACPTCGTTVTQTCRTREGHRTKPHPERELARVCACGNELARKRRVCDRCCGVRSLQRRRQREARRQMEAS